MLYRVHNLLSEKPACSVEPDGILNEKDV